MSNAGYVLLVLCTIAFLCDKKTRIYYGAFGISMLGHNCATLPLTAEYFDLAYLSSATLCAFLALMLPRSKDFLFLSIVCCSCVLINILGYNLWSASANIALYDGLYFGVYIAVIIHLIPKAYNERIEQASSIGSNFFRGLINSGSRRLGENK